MRPYLLVTSLEVSSRTVDLITCGLSDLFLSRMVPPCPDGEVRRRVSVSDLASFPGWFFAAEQRSTNASISLEARTVGPFGTAYSSLMHAAASCGFRLGETLLFRL